MLGKLTNLKILELDDCALMYEPEFLISIHEIIPPLETLIMTKEFDNEILEWNLLIYHVYLIVLGYYPYQPQPWPL